MGRVPSQGDFSVLSPAALAAQGPGRASRPAGSARVPAVAPGDWTSSPSIRPQLELAWGLPRGLGTHAALTASPPSTTAEGGHGGPPAGPLRPPRPPGSLLVLRNVPTDCLCS